MGPFHILGGGLSGLSAAIVLARDGAEVHVHERRPDSGARFQGDFEALENWTTGTDFLEQLRLWGIDPDSFDAVPFREIDLITPDDEIKQIWTQGTAAWIVERGTGPRAIDQGLKRQAASLGVHLHYDVRRPPAEVHIVATGPKQPTGLVRGEVFRTSMPNIAAMQFNDELGPGAYTYMIVVAGKGLICSGMTRRVRSPDELLDDTIAWYERHYPDLNRDVQHRFSGVASFGLHRRVTHKGRLYVGEAAGFQDCLWGFGMRHAITSGVLAAQCLVSGEDYESAIERSIRPMLRTSLANRWVLNRLGHRGVSVVSLLWSAYQRFGGDGLRFLARAYAPSRTAEILFRIGGESLLIEDPRREPERGVRFLGMTRADFAKDAEAQ